MAKTGYPIQRWSQGAILLANARPDPTLAEFETGPPDSGYSSPHRLPISITPTRLWPGYSTSSPHAHASSRHRGTRRVIFAVDVVVRAAEL